ncbi:MAG: Gfo/Idh/MocA family oxidoreductase [Pseudomonadota bacterium]
MLRFGLVGCGRIARRHADLLGGGQIDGAALGAVCDIKDDRAEAYGKEFGVPHFNDMHALAERDDIDAITILTESGKHADHATELARYGKPLIVEKPMALTLDDADRMIRACDQHDARLFIVKQNRFNLPVRKLREALVQGRFGKLILGTVRVRWCRRQAYYDQDSWRGTWALDGGVLANQASHHVDLLEWMMGKVDSVYAVAKTALADIEAEDTAVVVLKFANGALGVIEATTATRPVDLEGSISLLGEAGTVEIAGFAVNEMRHWEFAEKDESDADVVKNYSSNPPNVYGFGHKEYYQDVVRSITTGTPQLVDGLEGRKSLELISAIYESVETGKEVELRFRPRRCRLGEAPE